MGGSATPGAVDGATLLGLGLIGLVASIVLALVALRAFNGWLEFKRSEFAARVPTTISVGQRIDAADLRERVRRLEAIAAGVDL